MMKISIRTAAISIFLLLSFAGESSAGQVITEAHRHWAKIAVAQEKMIGGSYAPETLAVLYFRNLTGKPELDPLQKGIAFMLMTDLSKVDGIHLVERPKLQALVEEMGLGKSGLVERETTPRMGRLLQTAHVVGGNIKKSELDSFDIDPGILNTREERLTDLPDSKGLLNEINRMEKDILLEVMDYLKKSPKLMGLEEILRIPMSTSLEALLFFFRGLDESDHGNYQTAATFYRKSLKADPHLIYAAEALGELEKLNLILVSTELQKSDDGSSSSRNTAKPEDWRNAFKALLVNGKKPASTAVTGQPTAGLAYTPPESVTLEKAVSQALKTEKRSRVCECMKMAVDLDYNAYLVIKTIYEAGGDLEIDQLCMCATEAGIMKAVIAKAAREAVSPLGKPMYPPDEIAQANCFKSEEGLAYTPGDAPMAAIPVDTLGSNNFVSKSIPTP